MSQWKLELVALICVLGAATACAKSKADSSRSDTSGADAADASDDDKQAAIDCSKTYTSADAVGIMNLPAKVSNDSLWPGSCSFNTGNDGGSIKVRPGATIEMAWNDATQGSNKARYAPLAGVGEGAMRLASNGTDIVAKKGKLYCAVQLIGIDQPGTASDFTKTRGEELATKLGALCNKYFAAK